MLDFKYTRRKGKAGKAGRSEGYLHKSGSRVHLSYSSDEGNRNLYARKQQVKSHLLRINVASVRI